MSNSAFTPTILQDFREASVSQSGIVTTGTQSFAGAKTFTAAPVIGDASGIVAATGSVPGVVTTGAQTFAGVKTFSSAPVISNASGIVAASGSTVGVVDGGSQTFAGVKTFNGGIRATAGFSRLWVQNDAGFGSFNTAVRRFSNTIASSGSDITWTQDATNGDSFTVNSTGVYSIQWAMRFATATSVAIALNPAPGDLATGPVAMTAAKRPVLIQVGTTANEGGMLSCTLVLTSGDVIRAMADTSRTPDASDRHTFLITKIL